jgi:hypothetical protein
LEIFWLVISISLSTVSFVKMRESGIVGNGMGRAQFVCEASFRLNLFEGFLFQSETISDETPTIADAITIYRVLLPAVLLFFFLFFPAVCNLVVKLQNETTSRKRPLLEARHNSSS